ncbi:Swarming motility protein YbiA [Grifola frondosa]|uniref:Swarming motility protein YbiA n=1 Tax=Grifola frondosa TaxID=5627 RepID=A0A1C7M1I9_GRIFR|nr:Swarming motility protein YbiA [Grifola frondosa]
MIYPVMQQMPDGGMALIYNPPLPQGMHVTGGVTSGVVPGVDPARGPSPAHSARASTPRPPAIKLDRENELAGLLHFSPHSVHYQRKTYPTALHLLEALKFLEHQPDLAERIRTCATPEQASEMAEAFRQHVRPDWEQVFLHMIDEALYWKFMQHPYLRRLLMDTGQVDLVFSDSDDSFWGDGPLGQGANHLGNALMRVRQRLRAEGVHH